MLELSHINKELLYKVLATPSFSEKELRLQEFLMEYASQKDYECSIDDKGNIYMAKGKLSDGCFYPCVTAYMDTVQDSQVVFIDKDEHLPLITESREDGKHIIYTEGFGLGGDDKAGIVIALSIMDNTPICKAVFFVEEEIGCRGSSNCELPWFKDAGYIMAFDSPEGNCASWSCNGERLFDRSFYETHLEVLGEKFGLTKFVAHPYTDAYILRMDTCLACMNFGAGYYLYHTLNEYVVPEEMDNATTMGLYLIDRLGYKEYVLPFCPRYRLNEEDKDSEWFRNKFKQ